MVKDIVQDFYKDIPFNFIDDCNFYKNSILESNQLLDYIDLDALLRKRNFFNQQNEIEKVIEFGCGTGWLTNTISHYYKKKVTAIDFTKKAINIAAEVNNKLGLNSVFHNKNIFEYEDKKKYDLVISMGVLHHTFDCKKAFEKIIKFLKPGGYVYVGLYHFYSRKPMLNLLQRHARWFGDDYSYDLFKKMNNTMSDEKQNYSWFRDQVLHPRETQHTLIEIIDWLKNNSLKLESTSINNYRNLKDFTYKDLDKLEKELENSSFKTNQIKFKFNPGFFTFCAKNIA
tara:strand:+ start:502 stop:1356 length:855 start_codon:yes stop_codon:yes gene_type:complete